MMTTRKAKAPVTRGQEKPKRGEIIDFRGTMNLARLARVRHMLLHAV